MALEITGSIVLEGGVTISSAYARTEANLGNTGKSLLVYPLVWASKAAYDDGLTYIRPDFLTMIPSSVSYDRATDGVDILDFANESVKSSLEGLGYTVTITDL